MWPRWWGRSRTPGPSAYTGHCWCRSPRGGHCRCHREAVVEMYQAASANKDYQRIVATHHAERISDWWTTPSPEAKCVMGGEVDAPEVASAPVLTDIDPNAEILEKFSAQSCPSFPASFDESSSRQRPPNATCVVRVPCVSRSSNRSCPRSNPVRPPCAASSVSNHLPFGGLGNGKIARSWRVRIHRVHPPWGLRTTLAPEPCSCRRTPRGKPNWSTSSCAGCNCDSTFSLRACWRLLHLIALLLLTTTSGSPHPAQSSSNTWILRFGGWTCRWTRCRSWCTYVWQLAPVVNPG